MAEEVFIGIDPGIAGAVAAVDSSGRLLGAYHIPTLQTKGKRREINVGALRSILVEFTKGNTAYAALERVGARPGQGVVSMFRFGKACGLLEGLLLGLRVDYVTPVPRSWQKVMLRDVEGQTSKIRSVLAATRKWENLDLKLKKDHNKADAALLAEYARLTRGGV